ncbi:hypothetical protein, partial [Streptomyces sp. NP-1717]|uniref:hypothetical protein n=1 Tax=Streptomyces sp. NP-1717 TaxID=2704470 RepID=UPI001F5C2689
DAPVAIATAVVISAAASSFSTERRAGVIAGLLGGGRERETGKERPGTARRKAPGTARGNAEAGVSDNNSGAAKGAT